MSAPASPRPLTPPPPCSPLALQENLRQLCVFQLAKDGGKPWMWWDYVTRFGDECTMVGKSYDEACAEKVRSCAFSGSRLTLISDSRLILLLIRGS